MLDMTNRTRKAILVVIAAAASILAVAAVALAMPSDSTPTSGRIPEQAFRADGSIDRSLVPDFVVALDREGKPVGYVSKDDAIPQEGLEAPSGLAPSDRPEKVYGNDLKTIVGYMYPAKGFVPLGTDPETVPTIPVDTTPTSPPQAK